MFTYVSSVEEKDDLNRLKMLEHASMHTDFYPLMWHSAKGALVFNRNGDAWIDFTSAIAVANSGHSNEFVVDALKNALEEPLLATYNFPHRYRLELAEQLGKLLDDSTGESYGLHFMSSGSEAVESSIKVALDHHNQAESVIVSFYNAFHGNTLQSDSISGITRHSLFTSDKGDKVHYIKLPFQSRSSKTQSVSFQKNISDTLDKYGLSEYMVTGIIMEPYQGKGVFVADQQLINEVIEFCNATDALLIVDEIQSGFYRTSRRFAFEHFDISPDIICLGKGLTSSLPMSAIAVKRDIFNKSNELDIATTHSANPMSCVAAIANIKFMENKEFRQNLLDVSRSFKTQIDKLAEKYQNAISYSEVFGMVASLHITIDGQHSKTLAEKIARDSFKNGLLLSMPNGPHGSFLRITPPLVIKNEMLEQGMQILDNALSERL